MTYLYGYTNGIYHLSYVGSGQVAVGGIGSFATPPTLGADGRFHADVLVQGIGTNLLSLTITNINPANPVHDLKLIAPGYDPNTTQVFTDSFLHRLQPFTTLRFMDWLQTNGSSVVQWPTGPRPMPSSSPGRPASPTSPSWPWPTPCTRISESISPTRRATITSGSSRTYCIRRSTRA